MIMNPQYHSVYGGASVTQNAPYGMNPAYEGNPPYGQNAPYGANPNPPYGMDAPYGANPNPSYGMDAPYGANPNPSYGVNAPYGVTPPYGVNPDPSYGMNQPYEQNASYGTNPNPSYGGNVPYGVNQFYGGNPNPPCGGNASYGVTTPYGANPDPFYGMNRPYEQNASYGINPNPFYGGNVPYGGNQPYGANPNPPYGGNASYGVTTPFGANPNPPYGMNRPYEQNQTDEIAPVYGTNLPSVVHSAYAGTVSHGLPAVYAPTWQQGMIGPCQSRYQIAPNNQEHAAELKEGTKQLLLFSIAGVIIAAFLAIMIGMAIHDDGTKMDVSETFASWVGGLASGNEDDGNPPVLSFRTESAGTVRGEMLAVGEDGSVFLRTQYGVCRVIKNGNGYEYNGWAAELDPNLKIKSMAVYGDFLYLACGEDGLYRVNTARSNTLSQIIEDNVTSFVIAEDHLFYLSMGYSGPADAEWGLGSSDGYYGELYIAGLNGKGSRSLGEKVRYAVKYLSSADFIVVDGYLYFFDEEMNLKRMRADGTGSRVVVERERQKPSFLSCGLYENGGILYFPSAGGGIFAYDIEADKLKKVSDARVSLRSPLLFAGNALLYREEMECEWHQIKDGQDDVYESPLNNAELWMQAVGTGELLAFQEQDGYYDISFTNGEIRLEEPVVIDYDTMPEVDIEEQPEGPNGLFQGTASADYRASHFVFVGPNESSVYDRYVIFPTVTEEMYGNAGYGLTWTYEDENGEHTERLVDGEVGTFFVENDVLYYTLLNEEAAETEDYALFYQVLDDREEEAEGCLIEAGMKKEFACCDGMIYYVDADDGRLYRYVLWSGEREQISEHAVGCYDIYNGMIYYENLSDSTICRMWLDGSEVEMLVPFGEGALCQLTVCPYDDSVYFAVTMGPEYMDNGTYLFSEDGQMVLVLTRDLGDFDRRQPLYYRDGRLYYSASIAYEIHVFDFDAYFDGGSGIRADYEDYDAIFCSENMNTFEVTDEFVYVQMYMDTYIIKVFDRQTGELIKEVDCSEF